jgi:predicted  nucleic acid-binding Zn-ribbon protein
MAKTTKPNVAKTTPAKAVKKVAKEAKKVEKKPAAKKEPPAKKGTAKPVVAKTAVKKPVAKAVTPKPAKKPAPTKAAQIKPAEKKGMTAKPIGKSVVKKAAPAKPAKIKAATSKPITKPVVKKSELAKGAEKKIVATKPVKKPVVKKAEPVKPVKIKVATSKPATKPVVKKNETAKSAEIKVAPFKPVEKQVVKKATPAKSAEKTKKVSVSVPVQKTSATIKQEPLPDSGEVTIEKKLIALYNLQQIDSQVDKIRIIRGELPLEVQDLEDEIAGLETRIENYLQENTALEKSVTEKKFAIKDSQALIKKYEEQQMNVRNNREYDSLTKEIEIQSLEIQLSEKRIREFQLALEAKTDEINRFQTILTERKNDLEIKKNELDDIVAETEKEENELIRRSEINRKYIEERLITAYTRIRKNARNGLAVVQIERDACGGCFNKIPPQHQLDIRMHKKIIVCEYCGRILVDDGIVNLVR